MYINIYTYLKMSVIMQEVYHILKVLDVAVDGVKF